MATLADFFSLPIGGYGAKPNPYLKSESGRPVYETPLGVTFEIQPQAKSEDAKKRAIVDALVSGQKKSPFYGPAQAEMDVQRQGAEATLGGILPGLLQGVLQGVEAPGRAARGEPVTYGDAWATALDYGAIAAPAGKPAGAIGGGGIRAYHGSPHDFDRFDLSKIGTGEGKQAEGMGLYFAQNEDVARKYRDNLSNRAGHDAGRVYEVNIKADESDFVDFDQPLSGQPPAVQKWFDGRGVSPAFAGEQSGLELLMLERSAMGDDALATSMREAGIPGIKFRDNWSKGKSAQNATRNFVVFDDRLIEIVRKYGIAGAAAMLGMSAAELQAQMGGASAAPSADDLRSYLNELN